MNSQLKLLTKTYYDIQSQRIVLCSRLKKKKDGTIQNLVGQEDYRIAEVEYLNNLLIDFELKEKELEKEILSLLKESRIYNEFLKGVKGCGTFMSAVLLSEFNIYKATTVSKFYAFSGIVKGLVQGKKWNANKKEFVVTEDLIERDKLTGGYSSPFNKYLRTKLLGVLAGSFLKCNSPYRIFYDNYKNRKTQQYPEYSKMRIHLMSNRYMIKMFLSDFWHKWREIENLPIRCSYAEEYLNKKHAG